MEPLSARLQTYALWGTASGVVFFSVYPTTNWITSLRGHHYLVCLPQELAIPFWPQWIWVYLSMYVLFAAPPFFLPCSQLRRLGRQLIGTTLAAGLSFLLVPTTLGFARVAPEEGFLHQFYERMFAVDRPHNLVPSLHVVWSGAIALALGERCSPAWRVVFYAWALAITLSTLLVHQHHLLDLVMAAIFIVVARKVTREENP